MKSLRGWRRFVGTMHFLLLSLISSLAHGPLDNSATITTGEEEFEVTVTLGPDVAAEFFAKHLRGLPRPQPVGPGLSLPADAVGKMFSLIASNQLLVPREFRVLTDGLEYAFVARYLATSAVAWQFRAHYFDLVEQMAPGALQVQTVARHPLHKALLSRTSSVAEFVLPSTSANESRKKNQSESLSYESTAPVILTNLPRVEAPSARHNRSFGGVALVLMAVIVSGFLLGRRRS